MNVALHPPCTTPAPTTDVPALNRLARCLPVLPLVGRPAGYTAPALDDCSLSLPAFPAFSRHASQLFTLTCSNTFLHYCRSSSSGSSARSPTPPPASAAPPVGAVICRPYDSCSTSAPCRWQVPRC